VVHEAGGDLDDMTAALLLHLGNGELRDMEESGDVDAQNGGVVGLGVLGEGLAMKMPALLMSVSMRPNRARPSEITRSAVVRSAMSPGTARISSSPDGLIDRAVATTR
jgi:hypothetical protein